MNAPREAFVLCSHPGGLHRVHYYEWGDPTNPRVLLCVHGVTRNGLDFRYLAEALSADYRVVSVDVAGRGLSDWLPEASLYAVPQYVADLVTVIARLGIERVDWLGTSMGGLIGMALASLPGNPIARLMLNDVGPLISAVSINRIAEYIGKEPVFPDLAAAEAHIRRVSTPFGALSDAQWRDFTLSSVRPHPQGGFVMRYDPKLAESFQALVGGNDIPLWPLYEQIHCPTLVIRGAESDLLSRETVQHMQACGPRAEAAEIAGVGHAPMFHDAAQIGVVQHFLQHTPAPV